MPGLVVLTVSAVDDQDHGRAGNGGTAEAAWHDRGVRLDAVRYVGLSQRACQGAGRGGARAARRVLGDL